MGMVRMTHPDITGAEPALTTEDAYRTMWAPRGWELADDAVVTAGDVLGEPVSDLESLSKAQLLEVAANLGIADVNQRTAKADLVTAIQDHAASSADNTQEA